MPGSSSAGEEASHFYLILQGRVAVEIFSARRGPVTLQTLERGGAGLALV